MKILVYLITQLLLFATSIRADDITLVDGKTVFHNAKIISQDAASVTIKHSTGIARVMIPDLPPKLRAQFKYDPDMAKQQAAQDEQLRADHNTRAAALTAVEDTHRKALEAWNRAAVSLSGKILSVSDQGVILKGTGFGVGDNDIVFVKNVERGHVDDEQFSVVAVPSGTHHYSSAGNAWRTVPAFDAARP